MTERGSDKDIVVTGYRAITPLGDDEAMWPRILNGEKGFTRIRRDEEGSLLYGVSKDFCQTEVAGVIHDEDFNILDDPLFTEHRAKIRDWARAVRFGTWAGAGLTGGSLVFKW